MSLFTIKITHRQSGRQICFDFFEEVEYYIPDKIRTVQSFFYELKGLPKSNIDVDITRDVNHPIQSGAIIDIGAVIDKFLEERLEAIKELPSSSKLDLFFELPKCAALNIHVFFSPDWFLYKLLTLITDPIYRLLCYETYSISFM